MPRKDKVTPRLGASLAACSCAALACIAPWTARADGPSGPRGAEVARPVVAQVLIEGNRVLSPVELEEATVAGWSFADGAQRLEVFDAQVVAAIAARLQAAYVAKGYYLAEVDHAARPSADDPARVDVVFTVREFDLVHPIVSFEGNVEVSGAELREATSLAGASWFAYGASEAPFVEAALGRDLQRVTAFYYDRGYVAVRVQAPEVTLAPGRRHVHVVVPVDEGPRFKVGEVAFTGDDATAPERLRGLAGLTEGDWFDFGAMREGLAALSAFYAEEGYPDAEVYPRVDVDAEGARVGVTFEIDKGAKAPGP